MLLLLDQDLKEARALERMAHTSLDHQGMFLEMTTRVPFLAWRAQETIAEEGRSILCSTDSHNSL